MKRRDVFIINFLRLDKQLFTGVGDEAECIKNAARPGKITITTPALGRNTDVPYDKKIGMTVYQTFIDTTRKTEQRNGRTGRQGSPGSVHTILNMQDYPGLTIEQAVTQLEKAAQCEREFNEGFYNILGFFYQQVNLIPRTAAEANDFYRNHWSQFSQDLEKAYWDFKQENKQSEGVFIKSATDQFNRLVEPQYQVMHQELKQHLTFKYPDLEPVAVYKKPVKMSDCIPERYLCIFKPQDMTEEIREDVIRLLEDYLNTSWFFISTSKKREARKLIANCRDSKSVSALIDALNESQKTVLQADVRSNSLPMYRRIKAVNITGSRFQDTIDKAHALAETKTDQKVSTEHLHELNNKLPSNTETSREVFASYDSYKCSYNPKNIRDLYNARVVAKSTEGVLKRRTPR